MSSFYDKFFKFSSKDRVRIAEQAGLSIRYLLKHIYVSKKNPKFHLHNAVNLDRASGGALPFWEHTEGDVDWGYVLRRLHEAHWDGKIFVPKGNTLALDNNT